MRLYDVIVDDGRGVSKVVVAGKNEGDALAKIDYAAVVSVTDVTMDYLDTDALDRLYNFLSLDFWNKHEFVLLWSLIDQHLDDIGRKW